MKNKKIISGGDVSETQSKTAEIFQLKLSMLFAEPFEITALINNAAFS